MLTKEQKITECSQHIGNLNDWQKLPDFIQEHPQFTEQQMRWLLLHRKLNGLNKYVRKIGKPIYICVPGFLQWICEKEER